MDAILTNELGYDIGFLSEKETLDLEVGNTNDFEITINTNRWNPEILNINHGIFMLNTEYGGIIKKQQVNTKTNTIKFSGDTWRGMLAKKIIEPPSGEDYKIVTGDANQIINNLTNIPFGGLFVTTGILSGLTINYQFERYCTLLDGLYNMLIEKDYRLKIQSVYNSSGKMVVELSAVPIVDYSQLIETSQDSNIDFVVQKVDNGINHLICLGKGDLKDRDVFHLYCDDYGNIDTAKTHYDAEERTAVYENSGITYAELRNAGTKKFKEIISSEKQTMSIENMDIEMYDIVGGRERITDISLSQPVKSKVIKIIRGKMTIDYKIGGTN